jgi:hypothetical protein
LGIRQERSLQRRQPGFRCDARIGAAGNGISSAFRLVLGPAGRPANAPTLRRCGI